MGYYPMFFDWTYLLVIVGIILSMIASSKVKSTFEQYSRVYAVRGMTGAQAAQYILRQEGITDVTIGRISGSLTDHYDPRTKTVNLSDATYGSNSVAAVGVAAHECGHVLQHHTGYVPLQIRSAILPAANIGSKAGIPIILLGMLFSFSPLITIGIWVFSLAVLFQVVTLPVEFNASHRALVMLEDYGILGSEEVDSSRKVLTAAAMTYVASAASAVIQLLRLIALNNRRR